MPGDKVTGNEDTEPLPVTAERARAADLIRQNQGHILDIWMGHTFERVPATQDKGRAELADHFLLLLDDVVAVLRGQGEHQIPEDIKDLQGTGKASSMHGRERTVVEGYTVGQLSREYIVLRRSLMSFCRQNQIDDEDTLEIINRVIEMAALTAITAFSKSMQEIQQKLAGTLVHDVRTPLGVAYTYAELISVANMPAERLKEVSQTITRSLRRAINMLEELLDVTKLKAGQGLAMHFSEADVNKEIAAICEEARQIYSKRIVCSCESFPVNGIFDLGLITRTLENLISNAAKFGYEETPITITLQDCGEYVELRVHNQGEPIPSEERENIFCFFSAPVSETGADAKSWGLGLSLIKTVADNHGGEVIFDSAEGKGTTFGMKLYKYYHADGDEFSVLI